MITRTSVAGLAVWLGPVLLLAGCAAPAAPAAGGSAAPSTPAVTDSPTAAEPRSVPEEPSVRTVTVQGLEIPAIGLRADRLETLELSDSGVLKAPVDPDLAGWYAGGVVPGDLGPAVIAGHVDSRTGPAVFARLAQLGEGDRVVVTVGEHGRSERLTFTVDRRILVSQRDFPTEEVYGPSPDAQLRLITCGGPYDRTVGGYQENVVVFATLDSGGAGP